MRRISAPLGAVLLVALMAGPAAASPGTGETIVLMRDSQFNEIGWSATGMFHDSGSWASSFAEIGRAHV